MPKHFRPPELIPVKEQTSLFLAGTIDMGSSYKWQEEVVKALESYNIEIYNPRREDWDSSWKQGFTEPQFFQQVTWEMDAMERADIIVINFLPESKSPISLLELGLHASSGKLLVCCPDEFYRSGNVHIVCNRYSIPLYKNIKDLLKSKRLTSRI